MANGCARHRNISLKFAVRKRPENILNTEPRIALILGFLYSAISRFDIAPPRL